MTDRSRLCTPEPDFNHIILHESSWKLLEKSGLRREAHLRENIFFHRNDQGNPIWKDTYVYAILSRECGQHPETATDPAEKMMKRKTSDSRTEVL